MPWDDEENVVYFDENFTCPMARVDPMNETDPQLAAAVGRVRKAKLLAKTLAATRHKSKVKQAICDDRLRREAKRKIERLP